MEPVLPQRFIYMKIVGTGTFFKRKKKLGEGNEAVLRKREETPKAFGNAEYCGL